MDDKIENEFSEGKEISNEALEGVSGGSTYSSDTYRELGVDWDVSQKPTNHPLIVTWYNICSLSEYKCKDCIFSRGNVPMYCRCRSAEYDPVNGRGVMLSSD